jgi:hypothetical protein
MQTDALIEMIQALPPERIAEVEDFVAFLTAREQDRARQVRLAAMDRFLAVAPALEAAGAPDVTEDEIMAEVRAVRADQRARRAGAGGADRS